MNFALLIFEYSLAIFLAVALLFALIFLFCVLVKWIKGGCE